MSVMQEQFVFLEDLPVEILLKTFCFCDLPSLSSLSQTSQKFRCLCADEILWRKINRKLLLPISGPSLGGSSIERVSSLWTSLPAKKQSQLVTSCKSQEAALRRPTVVHFPTTGSSSAKSSQCVHKVLLDDRGVWTSNGEAVFRLPWHFRSGSDLTTDDRHMETFRRSLNASSSIGDFAAGLEHLVTGHWDGSLTIGSFSSDPCDSVTVKPHLSDVHSVALRDSLLFSGSRDHTLSLYNIDEHSPVSLVNFDDRIWSVTVHGSQPVIALGTSGTAKNPVVKVSGMRRQTLIKQFSVAPSNLRLYDFEREIVLADLSDGFKYGFGTLATQFVDARCLVSGGHDGLLRYWDLRQNRCVQELDSDLDSAVYCFATDGLFTVLTGHANYNAVCYFDRRYPRYSVKTRSFARNEGQPALASSSVYGLAFSPFQLYIGLADGLFKVDFCA